MTNLVADVVIIGAGPVGLFAAFQCGMNRLRCHVIDALPEVGGQCSALYPEKPIYDIPGFPKISAADLITNLHAQAAPFHPTYHLGHQVNTVLPQADKTFLISTDKGLSIQTRGVIIAAGVGAFGPNRPPLEGIEQYENTSIFYAVTRPERFRDKRVVIAGGGDSALDWALILKDSAAHVAVVHRRPKFRAAPESVAQLHQAADAGKISLEIPYQLERLEGTAEGTLTAVWVKDLNGGEKRLEAEILLPFYGLSMNLGPIATWGLNLDHQHIQVDPASCVTNIPGIYAVGDIVQYSGKLKLILTGFAEAALAAHSLRQWLFPDEVRHFEYSTTTGLPTLSG